jgi:hypothetical protein
MEAGFDRTSLIAVVKDNTRAMTALTVQIADLVRTNDRTGIIMRKLDERIESDRCPFLTDAAHKNAKSNFPPA